MARGYFRTDAKVCLFCGYTEYDENRNKVKMPYKYGKGANKVFLCAKCAEKTRQSGTEVFEHT